MFWNINEYFPEKILNISSLIYVSFRVLYKHFYMIFQSTFLKKRPSMALFGLLLIRSYFVWFIDYTTSEWQ